MGTGGASKIRAVFPGLRTTEIADLAALYLQDALREIVEAAEDPGPNWPYRGAQCAVTAQLIPESDNPHDAQAVRVGLFGADAVTRK